MPVPARSSQPPQDSRFKLERIRQIRGLMILALAVLLFSIWRAGFHNVFTPGWWRLW
jgi:hypothetical protein